MASLASAVIKLAEQEVGYLEKETNAQLNYKTANAGDENYTKYAKELHAAGYYNGNKNGYAWCDVFVDWLFFKAFGKDVGQKLQCQTGNLGAGCKYSAQYYKNAGRLHNRPDVGDQIFFKNTSGQICHTGLVVEVTKTRVYTIEGNTSSASGVIANGGAVAKKSYSINYPRIYGYGRPRYEAAKPVNASSGGVCEVELPVLKKGSKGECVKSLQLLLMGNNCPCGKKGADGSFGNDTEMAVEKYQRENKLTPDKVVGKNTWASLLGVK